MIKSWQKTTLIDYPDHIATIVFTGGCNFRCGYCHNGWLVKSKDIEDIDVVDVFNLLEKRKAYFDGVVICGGEPTLHGEKLKNFTREVKSRGFKVKLDTNGYNPNVLEELLNENLLDYVAMDIKNSEERYAETVGLDSIDIEKIKRSIDLILKSGIDHEFRTTLVKEYHTKEDAIKMARLIKGCKSYVLQQYEPQETQLSDSKFTPFTKKEMIEFKEAINLPGEIVKIRAK